MAPHLSTLLVMIPVFAFVIWRRLRTQFGMQPIRPYRMILRAVIFAVLCAGVAFLCMRDMHLLEGLTAGLVAGAMLGLLGLRFTQFQFDADKGDCYVPNAYIGALVTVLFLARLLWRFTVLSPQISGSAAAASSPAGPEFGQSPLTLAMLGLFAGYYICYFAGLLMHYQRVSRSRLDQPV